MENLSLILTTTNFVRKHRETRILLDKSNSSKFDILVCGEGANITQDQQNTNKPTRYENKRLEIIIDHLRKIS